MIALLGRAIGLRPKVLLLVLLLFVSASIEVGALLLTAPDKEEHRPSRQERSLSVVSDEKKGADSYLGRRLPQSYSHPVTPDVFLEAAKDGANLPFIHGRDKTAEKLGLSSAEAKRLVGRLIAEGRIVAEGKRLRLCSDIPAD